MEVFGPYLLLRPLGRGGMGVVYTARTQDSLHPLVALKRMRADADVPTFRERFEHECALALRLRHPHLLETLDAGALDRPAFDRAWAEERTRLRELARSAGGGGDFYRTTLSRVSRRFARALVESTLEGQTLYRDAFRMLGVKKTETFNNLGREVGVLG